MPKDSPLFRQRILRLFLIVFLLSTAGFFQTASSSKNFSSKKKEAAEPSSLGAPLKTFEVGEALVFDVSWMGIPVGSGTLQVKEKVKIHGREAFHVVAIAQTNDFLTKIYPIYDEIHSFIDTQEFYSLEFRKNLKEGRYRADEVVVYDHENKIAHYESFRSHDKKEIQIPPKVHDLISAFFWFRLQPWEVGKSLHTVVNSEEQNWDLEVDVLKQETKNLRGGRVIETVLVEPKTRLKGVFYDRGRAWVNFTIDSKRAPIWIKLQTPFGPMIGALRAKGLSD